MARYMNADAFVKNMSEIKESILQSHSLKSGNEPIDGYDADLLRAIGFAKQLVDEFHTADVRENEYSHKAINNGFLICGKCGASIDFEDKYCHECGRVLLSEGE